MYHRKQEKLPADRKETSKLLIREQAVHTQKSLPKDPKHLPPLKAKPVKKVVSKTVKVIKNK